MECLSLNNIQFCVGPTRFSRSAHRQGVDDSLVKIERKRESHWTESIAMGSEQFVKRIHSQLGVRVKGRRVIETGDAFQLREKIESYSFLFDSEKCDIAPENTLEWFVNIAKSDR